MLPSPIKLCRTLNNMHLTFLLLTIVKFILDLNYCAFCTPPRNKLNNRSNGKEEMEKTRLLGTSEKQEGF